MPIAVIGIGRLGAPLATILAAAGHDVIGVDRNQDHIDLLNQGRSPVEESGLAELIASNRQRLRAMTDTAAAVAETDVSFIVVPTPSSPSGAFSNQFVLEAIAAVGRGLQRAQRYHVVVITSTVMPRSTNTEIATALERASGRVVARDVGLCYNPQFVALGSVIHDLIHPDFVLIGESDARAGGIVEDVHRSFVAEGTQIRHMSCVNAEIAKIAVNTFVTTKISYANMLAELCERIPGGDVDVVTTAIGIDRRIGGRYLRGVVGYGGPCFPRDNSALAAAAAQVGAHADLAVATDAINRRQVDRVAGIVRQHATSAHWRVGILGLSYKPDTPVVEQSQGVLVANRLADDGFAVSVFDPTALEAAASALAPSISRAPSLGHCLDASDMVAVMVPWQAFGEIPALLHSKPRRPLVILDCWRFLDPALLEGVADLVYLGKTPATASATQ